MNTTYRRTYQQSSMPSDPFWMLVVIVVLLAFAIWALPAILIALITQRLLASRLHWRLSFLLWLMIAAVSAYILYHQYPVGLQAMMGRELALYILEVKHHQIDITQWNLQLLWSATWPMWLRTLIGIPIAGLWFEVSAAAQGGNVVKLLQRKERQRERQAHRSHVKARRRTQRPERLADSAGGMMVIGVPIHEKEE